MLIVDKIVTGPVGFVVWLAREISGAVADERQREVEHLTVLLAELNRALEQGEMDEEEFEAREDEILDRLDELEGYAEEPAAGEAG